MRILLPILLLVGGAGVGIGAGLALRPPPEPACDMPPCEETVAPPEEEIDPTEGLAFVELSDQFIVPVVVDNRVETVVAVSLAISTAPGGEDAIFEQLPRLRDVFLRSLFAHAASGGFSQRFASPQALDDLRASLREAALDVAPGTHEVLIVSLTRQDLARAG